MSAIAIKEWFFWQEDKSVGPVSKEELVHGVSSGDLNRDTMIWGPQSSYKWTPLYTLLTLKERVQATTPSNVKSSSPSTKVELPSIDDQLKEAEAVLEGYCKKGKRNISNFIEFLGICLSFIAFGWLFLTSIKIGSQHGTFAGLIFFLVVCGPFAKISELFERRKSTQKTDSQLLILKGKVEELKIRRADLKKRSDDIYREAYELYQKEFKRLRRKYLSMLKNISPLEFEEIVADMYRIKGYKVTITPPVNDHGIDIWLVRDGEGRGAVQCKRYLGCTTVGRPEIQQFIGALETENADWGVFVTTGKFASTAQSAAIRANKKIELIDGVMLRSEFHRTYGSDEKWRYHLQCSSCGRKQELQLTEQETINKCVCGDIFIFQLKLSEVKSASLPAHHWKLHPNNRGTLFY